MNIRKQCDKNKVLHSLLLLLLFVDLKRDLVLQCLQNYECTELLKHFSANHFRYVISTTPGTYLKPVILNSSAIPRK